MLFLAVQATETKVRRSTGVATTNSTNRNPNVNKLSWAINYHETIRGKFSSVHPDLAAEGITRVEVEGLQFIVQRKTGELPHFTRYAQRTLYFKLSDEKEGGEMVGCQLESEEKKDGMVTVAVTIDMELLRRIDVSGGFGSPPP